MTISRLRLMLFLFGLLAIGASRMAEAQSSTTPIRKVYVPAEHPERWPKGNWIPLAAERLPIDRQDKFLQTTTPKLTWIRKALYSATFRDGFLLEGELELELTSFPDRNRQRDAFVPWSDVNLAISRLDWQQKPAEIGTSLAEESWLIVPPDVSRLSGNWSFRGRALSRGFHFQLKLPESAVSQFQLRIPREMEFQRLRGGTFERVSLPDSEIDLCTVSLSSNQPFEFVLVPETEENPKRNPSVYYHGESSLTFSRDEVRFRRELLLEVLDQPLETLLIPLPPHVALRELDWGGVPLSTWSLTTGSPALLRIDLPEPVFGLSRPLRIAGTIPFVLDEKYAPPSMAPQNAVSLSEQISFYLSPPLELKSLDQTGFRQSAASTNQNGSSLLVFQQLFPDPKLELVVGLPAIRMQAAIATRLEPHSDGTRAMCDVLGKISSGASYTFPLLVSEGWEPLSVAYAIGNNTFSADETDWLLAPVENRRDRKLILELGRAVTREQPISIELTLQANPSSPQEPTLPVVRTPPEIPAEHRLLISDELFDSSAQKTLATWIPQAADQWPSELRQTRNGKALELKPNGYRLLGSTAPEPTSLPSAKTSHSSQRTVSEELIWTDDAILDRVEITIAAAGLPIDRIRLQLPRLNDPLSWSLDHASAKIISATLVQRDSATDSSDREILELVFSEPLRRPTLLRTQRVLDDANGWQALLPVLLEQNSFSGRVLLVADEELQPKIRERVRSTQMELQDREPVSSEAPFLEATYQSSEARLTGIGASSRSDKTAISPSEAQLRTRFYPAESGTVLSQFEVAFVPSAQQIQFQLPVEPADIWVELDGQPLVARKLSSADTFGVAVPPGSSAAVRLKISYRTRHEFDSDRFDLKIPVPQIAGLPERPFEWNMLIPPDLAAARFSPQLRLHRPLSEMNWSRRLFGPLGRSDSGDFFSPTDRDDWDELLSANSQEIQSLRDEQAVPADWQVFRLSGIALPEAVSCAGWSKSAQLPYAWILLLCSLLLGALCRILRLASRRAWGIVWFSLIIPGTIVVSPQFALYTGALLGGSLFAILIPRTILLGQQPWAKDETEIRVPASPEQLTTLAKVCLIAALSAGSLVAQNSPEPTASRKSETSSAIDVLIPLGPEDDRKTLPAFVYIREQDRTHRLLEAPLRQEPLLITSAEYRCRLAAEGPIPLQVKYQIYLPPGESIERIAIPLVGANLARDVACQVDGIDSPVQVDANGFLEIRLVPPQESRPDAPLVAPRPDQPPRSSRKEIVLNLYPPVASVDSGRQFQIEIPRIPQSFLTCELGEIALPQVQIADLSSELRTVAPGIVRGELGENNRLAVRWGETPPEPLESASSRCLIETSPLLLIEAHPTYLLYRYRVSHRAIEGATDFLRWTLPPQFELRKVRTDSLLRRTESVSADRRTILYDLLEPLTPESEPVVIEAEFLVDPHEVQEDELAIPIPALFPTDRQSTTSVNTLPQATQLGIHSPPELPLTLLEFPEDRLRTISRESFLARWPEDASLQIPEFSFEATTPTAMKFLFTQVRPSKRAWVSETGTFEDHYLEWTWNAEVQTDKTSAFEHEFRVDPRLEIVSVSVQEDQAQRVHRWFQTDNRLTVRLARKTESSQQISILARMDLTETVDFVLPEIRLLGAERMESLLDLRASAHWQLTFDPPEDSAALRSETSETSDTPYELVARLERAANQPFPIISLLRVTPPIEATRQTRIRLRADGDFDLQTELTVPPTPAREPGQSLAVVIPETWIPRLNLASQQPPLEWNREPLPDGRLRLTTSVENRQPDTFQFQTTVAASTSDEWTLHLPELSAEATYRDLYFLKPADGWMVDEECRETTQTTPATPGQFDAAGFERIASVCSPLKLMRAVGERAGLQPVIPLALARIDVVPLEPLSGRWLLFYEGRGKSTLVLELPKKLSSWEIEIDGEISRGDYDAENSRLSCPLPTDRSACWIEIGWTIADLPVGETLTEVPLLLPVAEEIPILRSEVILAAAGHFKLGMHNGFDSHSALVTNAALLAQLAELKQKSATWGETFPPQLESLLQSLSRSLKIQFDTLPQNDPERAALQQVFVDLEHDGNLPENSDTSPVLSNRLFPEMILEEGLSNQTIVHGTLTPARADTDSKSWFVSETLIRVASAVLLFLVLIPVLRLLLRPKLAEWLAGRRAVTYLILGVFWWTCLDFSFVGLVIACLSLVALLFGPRRPATRVAPSSR